MILQLLLVVGFVKFARFSKTTDKIISLVGIEKVKVFLRIKNMSLDDENFDKAAKILINELPLPPNIHMKILMYERKMLDAHK